jgi:DNA polymerase-1
MLFGGIQIPGHPDPANIQKLDLLPVEQIRRMHRVGVAIDREHLWTLSTSLESRKTELRKDIASYVPSDRLEEFVAASSDDLTLNVESAAQIATLLFTWLGVGKERRLKRTKSGTRISTGKKQLEGLKRDHPVIPLILEYREASKLKSTYADKLPRIARLHKRGPCCSLCGLGHVTSHWRIHTTILTTRTDTGRLASKNPNLQNIPTRTKLGREIRKAFISTPGRRLVSRDYSQIELRLLAHCAQEPNMLRIFRANGDIHLDTAMRAFNISDPKLVDPNLHRAPCKNVNFGIVFGLMADGLYDLMMVTFATAGLAVPDWLTLEWCERFIEKWFDLYPLVRAFMELLYYRARRFGIEWTPLGRVRRVPETRSCHERVRAAGLRQAGNMPIQGFAADTFKIGMGRAEHWLENARAEGVYAEALLPVHDELLLEADEDWADEVGEFVGYEMTQALTDIETGEDYCRVPILSDGHSMTEWKKAA